MRFDNYEIGEFFDEMFASAARPRATARRLLDTLEALPEDEILNCQRAAERSLLQMGITFNVYGEQAGAEKIFPFDILPRIISATEWSRIEKGLKQRIHALNLFIDDIYHDQKVLRDGVVPREIVYSAQAYRQQCIGWNPPRGIWCHITGTDLVRHRDGQIYVLEDNLRCPSGVSYVLENRQVMKSLFPAIFATARIRPVSNYPNKLRDMLEYLAADDMTKPRVVLLSPFRGDSLLGVPGLMEAYKAGNVALANAPGTGVADDKVVYAYVPRIVKYYLDEEIILPNVPTYVCAVEKDLNYVLEHLDELVVKAANESGGYGMLVGPHSTAEQRVEFAGQIKAQPRNYIAQPTLALSRVPTIVGDKFEGRHVDLRPYILCGKEIFVLPGGLTRVALKKGSLVVNSSQGGGSKDTWVLAETPQMEHDELDTNTAAFAAA